MIVAKEVAQEALRPYMEKLRECIVGGFEAWEELGRLAPKLRVNMQPRTRAGFVYDQIIALVRVAFAGMKNVRIIDRRGFPELMIDGEYVIRFKKLDSKGRSRNILTKQTRLWLEQQLTLPEMPMDSVRLIAGYVLDDLGSAVERVLVTCPKSITANEWAIDVEDSDAASTVIPFSPAPGAPKSPSVRSAKRKTQNDSDPNESA